MGLFDGFQNVIRKIGNMIGIIKDDEPKLLAEENKWDFSPSVADPVLSNGMRASEFITNNPGPFNIEYTTGEDFCKITKYSYDVGRSEYVVNLLKSKRFGELVAGKYEILDQESVKGLIKNDENFACIFQAILISKDVSSEVKRKILQLYNSEEFRGERHPFFKEILKNAYCNNDVQEFSKHMNSMFEVFMNNDVPDFLKSFELYRYAKNSFKNENPFLVEEEDYEIIRGLFRTSLESGERSLKDMASLLIDGENIINKYYKNGQFDFTSLSKEESALVYQYSDTMIGLHNVSCSINGELKNIIGKSNDRIKNLQELSKKCGVSNGFATSEIVLKELFSKIIDGNDTVTAKKILDSITNLKKLQEQRSNDVLKKIHEQSEIVKSPLYKYVRLAGSDYRKGMVSLEKILQKGLLSDNLSILQSNENVLDSYKDWSKRQAEVSLNYENNNNASGVYIVFSKENLGGTKDLPISYKSANLYRGRDDERIECGVGSLNISHIVATKWNQDIAHAIAVSGMYVPVVDQDNKLLFSKDDYDKIRAKEMQGLSYYGTGEYVLDKRYKDVEGLLKRYEKFCQTNKIERI